MKDIPIIEPKEVITTITNMKTGEVYKDDTGWKAKNIPESDTEVRNFPVDSVRASSERMHGVPRQHTHSAAGSCALTVTLSLVSRSRTTLNMHAAQRRCGT